MTLTGRTGTIVVVLAVASFCLNLLLIGVIAGSGWHGHWRPDRGDRMARMLERLPEASRPVVQQAFEANKAEFDKLRQSVQESRVKVADLLKADTIDRAQLEQALDEMSQRMQAMYGRGRQVMIDVAQKLPADQRREIVDRWMQERDKRD